MSSARQGTAGPLGHTWVHRHKCADTNDVSSFSFSPEIFSFRHSVSNSRREREPSDVIWSGSSPRVRVFVDSQL